MSAIKTRGGQLAIAVAAILVLGIGLAAGGAFNGCAGPTAKSGRPSADATSSPYGGIGNATARVFAQRFSPRVADTWGEIRAREFIMSVFEQYGYFPRTVEFISGAGARRVHSANVVAVKEGTSARELIVGAHYDSTALGQGFSDNATGVGLLLETAGRLKRQATPYTVVFVAFGAEESGLAGSREYVRALSPEEQKKVVGMIDLDAVAGGDQLAVASRPGGATWLRDDALTAAKTLGVPLTTAPATKFRPAGVTAAPSDDLPFSLADIATAVFSSVSWKASHGAKVVPTKDGAPIWHSRRDTVKFFDIAYPGRVKSQLHDLSRLLETLLTSELKRKP